MYTNDYRVDILRFDTHLEQPLRAKSSKGPVHDYGCIVEVLRRGVLTFISFALSACATFRNGLHG